MKANLSWITDDLAVGGDMSLLPEERELQVRDIIEQGITHIIDLRAEAHDQGFWDQHGIEYVSVGTHDRHGHVIVPAIFDVVVAVARIAAEAKGKVLVHCHMGVNRGPSAGFAILLDRGMEPIDAFDLIKEKREQALIGYAGDALYAHQMRTGLADEMDYMLLARHIQEVNDDDEIDRIQAVIDAHYAADQTAWERTARMVHGERR